MTARPPPRRDPLDDPFWAHAAQGRLAAQRCDDCGDLRLPPSPVCPVCLSDRQSWQVVSGAGTLESWVTFHRAYWPGFAPDLPLDLCLVRLREGPLLLGTLRGGTAGARLGEAVRIVFEDVDGAVLPNWSRVG